MTKLTRHLLEQTALSLISAFLFVLFFQLNAWVFASLEYSAGINWVFLPAGFRVILVLVLGLPGALGLMLGSWVIDSAFMTSEVWFFPIFNGIVSGLTPWLVMVYLTAKGWLGLEILSISPARLLQVTLIFSAASAISDQLVWWLLEKPDANILVDVWPMFVGNALGALLMLYGFKFAIDRFRLHKSKHIS